MNTLFTTKLSTCTLIAPLVFAFFNTDLAINIMLQAQLLYTVFHALQNNFFQET